jgi:nucleoside-diphosphate-sugar epimerase
MNKSMFFISMNDVCKSFKSFIDYILTKDKKNIGDVDHIFNLAYPTPVKIIDLANSIIDSVKKNSNGKILPKLSIVDLGIEEIDSQIQHQVSDMAQIDISKINEYLNISSLTKPEDVIDQIIRSRLDKSDESHG